MRLVVGFIAAWLFLFMIPTGSCIGPFWGKQVCSSTTQVTP